MANLSQITVNSVTYTISDLYSQNNLSTLTSTVTNLQTQIDNLSNNILPVTKGGTGASSLDLAAENLYLKKVSGQQFFDMSSYHTIGFISADRKAAHCSIPLPYAMSDTLDVTLWGYYKVLQNGVFLFGSTSSEPFYLDGNYTARIHPNGYINVAITTGSVQSSATAMDACSIIFYNFDIEFVDPNLL